MQNKYLIKNNEEIAYRVIDNEAVIINLNNNSFHTLNQVGTYIWEQIDGKSTLNQIIEKVYEEFEVDHKILENDINNFINELLDKNIIYLSLYPEEK